MTVRVVLRPDASSETVERVASAVRGAVEAAGAVPPPVEVDPVAEIEREPGDVKLKVVKTVSPLPA